MIANVLVWWVCGVFAVILTRHYTREHPGIRSGPDRADAIPAVALSGLMVAVSFYPSWTILSWFSFALAVTLLFVAAKLLTLPREA